MKQDYRNVLLTLLLVIVFLSIPRPVYAYIGPGTLTMLLQVLAGLMVGGATLIVIYWGKIKSRFQKKDREQSNNQ